MSYLSGFRFRRSVRTALGLILVAAGLPAGRGEAQNKPKAAPPLPEYRLTEPMVRKVSAVMREWDPTPDLGTRLSGGDVGMSQEQLKALPDSQQERILVENMDRAKAKYKEGEQQIFRLVTGGLVDRTAAAERIPALKAALGRAGFSTSEFLQAYNAYHQAMVYVLSEELGPGSPLPAGVRQDNVNLFRAMAKAEPLWTVMGLSGK